MVNRNDQKRDIRFRPAFTLIEIVLVLALLVMITAIGWPVLRGPLAAQRLRSAAEQVRTAWATARVEAMTTGQIHTFRYQTESGTFHIEAWGGFDAAIEGGLGDDQKENETLEPVEEGSGEKLPENVVFIGAIQRTDARAIATSESLGGSSFSGDASSGAAPPVLFYPDGSTSTVELQLTNDQAQFVVISLRGLTGIVTVGQIFTDEESSR